MKTVTRRLRVSLIALVIAASALPANADPVKYDFTVLLGGIEGSGFFVFDDAYLAPPDIFKEIPTLDIGFSWGAFTFDNSNAGICGIKPSSGDLYWWQLGGSSYSFCSDHPLMHQVDFGVILAPGHSVPNFVGVDLGDGSVVYGYGGVTSWSRSNPVPVPASLLLFGTGLVGLRAWRTRRQ